MIFFHVDVQCHGVIIASHGCWAEDVDECFTQLVDAAWGHPDRIPEDSDFFFEELGTYSPGDGPLMLPWLVAGEA